MSDNDDNTTEEDNTSEVIYKPSFVLIAIDTHPSMFVKNEERGTTPFKDCITACYELADSLILTQNKRNWSPFAIVLAQDDDSASFVNFNNNVLDTIKFLKEKSQLSEEELLDIYQKKGQFDLSAFFLLCKKKFKEINSVFYKRTIIYITNDDNPVRGDKNLRFAAINEAKNFEANEIELQVVTMNDVFDYNTFYNELFYVTKSPAVETFIEDKEGLLEKLMSLIVVRYYQRKLAFFPFKGDHSRFIKVVQKKLIAEQKLYNNAHVNSSGKPVKKKQKTTVDEAKGFVLKYSTATDELEFDLQEKFDLKNNDLPVGYSLFAVSNQMTEIGAVLTDSDLLEVDHKEDLQFFSSFWQYCVDNNEVLVCIRKTKRLDNIRFVELIPKFANNAKVFVIKTIPFISEIKYPPSKLDFSITSANSTSEQKIKATNKLIDALTFDYHPKMFINPVYAKKKAFLKAKFLDEEIEDVEDVTIDNKSIDERLSNVGDEFRILFNLDQETGKKRKTATTSEKSKRRK